MYQPKKYKKQDPEYLYKFIEDHPFATILVQGERLLATHIPVLIEGAPQNFRLYFHIANFNEMLPFLKEGAEVLIVFQGVHGYISSSWYKKKDISTWDYSAVHINANVKMQTSAELESSLEKLVHKFERGQEKPLFYKEIPKAMLKEHLPLITGFWCEPYKIEAVAKLHQSYKKQDVTAVIEHLEHGTPMEMELSKDIKKEHD
ncbi:PaiB family negative transcriptional regulator [Gillisia sp. Hel_I_86]|uniref:FMN-binding negative transcriptional regulator n=1 Tax=Gillisia sp. Hel_I_86 TaxID=1249981 RepID=UPI00119C5409|nr:FMN-binding negative transcriptional regulator [Gillisia sp. Hel_I_86]TVZ26676.1 PaiB family negative transcriptional regulator [Gillisia sp. Hel_I_86]